MLNLRLSGCYFVLFLFVLALSGCSEEEPLPQGPTTITITHQSIYEKLPRLTSVGMLGTDVTAGALQYILVSGEGSTHNTEFKIEANFLKTFRSFEHADGASRNIRIKVTDGTNEYEQVLTINITKLEGDSPAITSMSFIHNGEMPKEFGADNGNVSPDLEIANVPANAKSIALSMIDEDDNGSVHWRVWNIPTDKTTIKSNQTWDAATVEGNNAFGEGYTGPFPPSTHRYKIIAYFLSEELSLEADQFGKLESEMIGKLIAQASIIGKYTP